MTMVAHAGVWRGMAVGLIGLLIALTSNGFFWEHGQTEVYVVHKELGKAADCHGVEQTLTDNATDITCKRLAGPWFGIDAFATIAGAIVGLIGVALVISALDRRE
jgi:uncharacterized membrane protein